HYFNNEDYLATKGSLRGNSVSLLAYVAGAGSAASQSIANATRTTNVVFYKTPDFGPFWMIVAYSANPFAAEADINSTVRRGNAWNLNPNFSGQNWQVGYSYWTAKQDNATAVAAAVGGTAQAAGDQRGDRLYGHYEWNGFRVGLAWDKSKIKNSVTGVAINNRSAWSIPLSYNWGNNTIFAHFDRAGNDKAFAAGTNSKATMFAVSYAYDLSKRTSVAVTYARINNSANSNYNLFTATSLGVGVAPAAGEDPRLFSITMRHAY
ncbi:MAG TPA: porin, partial [Burkholderiales bacterium]